ncbi:hypothetical protein BDW71DRAFT_193158 [Aspergillus fruticulosus]
MPTTPSLLKSAPNTPTWPHLTRRFARWPRRLLICVLNALLQTVVNKQLIIHLIPIHRQNRPHQRVLTHPCYR